MNTLQKNQTGGGESARTGCRRRRRDDTVGRTPRPGESLNAPHPGALEYPWLRQRRSALPPVAARYPETIRESREWRK